MISYIFPSYYKVVVFIVPLQGLYAILFEDTVDCFITNSDREVSFKPFAISNSQEGFEKPYCIESNTFQMI